MYVSISVDGLTASTRGAPSKPTADRWASSAWVAGQQGAIGLITVSPTRTTRPRLAVAPGSVSPSARNVRGLEPVAVVGQAEQGSGETRVGDKAMDQPSSDRGAYRRALGDAEGDGEDERDPLQHRAGRDDHAAVQRRGHRPAVLADEHPGQLGADAESGEAIAFGRSERVIDGRQPGRPG